MCKVFMLAGIKDETREKAQKLVTEMAKIISIQDGDGVGYATITANGEICGEKWVNRDDAFKIHENPPEDELVKKMQADLGTAAKFKVEPRSNENVYGRYGRLANTKNAVACILHARKMTIGVKSIENTHPFFNFSEDGDTALIHNGSIANHHELTKVTSTCDSEVILHEYINRSMNFNPWVIHELAKTLIGEYAVGVLSSMKYTDGSIQPILDVFKSNKDLYVAWIEDLGTYAFCTSEYNLEAGCRNAGLTHKHMMEVQHGKYLRFDAITGERIEEVIDFELSERGTTYRGSHHRPGGDGATSIFPYGPHQSNVRRLVSDDGETIEDVKRHFERNHETIFNQQYVVPNGLTTDEKELYEQLAKDPNTKHKALRLVASVLSIAQG
jgi:hypothetical protein